MALLENPIGTTAENYLPTAIACCWICSIPRLKCATPDRSQCPTGRAGDASRSTRLRPYVIPVGGSNALGALGYVEVRWKSRNSVKGRLIFRRWWCIGQCRNSRRTGCWAGTPDAESELIGVTVSRSVADQLPKVLTYNRRLRKNWS